MAETDQTLLAVLARLDALEQRNEALAGDNAILKQQNAALLARANAQPTPADWTRDADGSPLERMSRRWVLRRGMQTAAGAAAAGLLLVRESDNADAHHYGDAASANTFHTHYLLVLDNLLYGNAAMEAYTTHASRPAVRGKNDGAGPGIYGLSVTGTGVRGNGAIGMHGTSNVTDKGAIWGQHTGTSGVGVVGDGTGALYSGVLGRNPNGSGVRGDGAVGVHGTTPITGNGAVYGQHLGTGNGVVGHGAGAGYFGVLGRNTAGIGVRGEGKTGVHGESSTAQWGAVTGKHTGIGYGVVGDGGGATEAGVLGRNSGGHGVRGEGLAGVVGTSLATGWEGVYGQHTGTLGYGVVGDGTGDGSGVLGRNPNGSGVRGDGAVGVHGTSTSDGYSAIYGEHTSTGNGVLGAGVGAPFAGVLGRNTTGDGVRGEGTIGVRAKATTATGYGVVAEGGQAQLRLVPRSAAGKPTSGAHSKGELLLDSAATLWICTVGGTPGTWRKVSTTIA